MSDAKTDPSQSRERSNRLVACAYVAAAIAAILPIMLVEIPALVDYPNHLARLHVLAQHGSSPELQQNYLIDWRLIPNLAIDGVAALLGPFLSPMAAGRVFLALAVLSVAGGTALLHKVLFGRLGLWPLASFGLAYSLPFAWGLVSFQFSIGLCLVCCAAWIASERRHPALRIAVFNLAALAIYLSHLFGYAALLFAIGLYELSAASRQSGPKARVLLRRFALTSTAFALPAIMFLVRLLAPDNGMEPLALGSWYGDVFSKLSALLSAFLFYGGVTDLGLVLAVIALAATALLAGRFVVAPAMAWPLAGFLILTLAAPNILRGLFLDARLGFVLGCFFIAGTKPAIDKPALRAALHAGLMIALVMRFASVIQIWQARGHEYAEFREASHVIEPGSRILTIHDNGDTSTESGGSVRWYMAVSVFPAFSQALAWRNIDTLAVIERQVYTPTLFKNPSSQPLRSAARHREIDPVAPARRVTVPLFVGDADGDAAEERRRQAAAAGETAFWAGWPRRFDYIVVIRHPRVEPARFDDLPMRPAAAGSFFDIYRVEPPG